MNIIIVGIYHVMDKTPGVIMILKFSNYIIIIVFFIQNKRE